MAEPRPAPAVARAALLVFPPLLAAGLWWQAQHHDAGLVAFEGARTEAQDPLVARLPETLAGLPKAGVPRHYRRDNLYEYVNGHAEYYLSAGFEGLLVVEYGADSQGQPLLVANLWDMGRPLHALGVLMDEAGPQAAARVADPPVLETAKGLSFAHGARYVQLTRFAEGVDLNAATSGLRPALGKGEGGGLAEIAFPDFGAALATRFVKEGYRGYDALANVVERRFARDGGELTAFVVEAAPAKVAEVQRALLAFLATEGIPHRPVTAGAVTLHHVEDRYEGEWFFAAGGGRLVGAFAPPDDALAQAVAAHLQAEVKP
ncbi:MAG: hypothetical protein MUE39_01300 [Gammaproteobacteria bacterium]|nr:hypothetical protein [Gammaproteobacteria bacterium]